MNEIALTCAYLWPYASSVSSKLEAGFDSLSVERILPLCGIFYVRKSIALLFFWVGTLGSRKARRAQLRSVNPIYPPATCPACGGGFSDRLNKGA